MTTALALPPPGVCEQRYPRVSKHAPAPAIASLMSAPALPPGPPRRNTIGELQVIKPRSARARGSDGPSACASCLIGSSHPCSAILTDDENVRRSNLRRRSGSEPEAGAWRLSEPRPRHEHCIAPPLTPLLSTTPPLPPRTSKVTVIASLGGVNVKNEAGVVKMQVRLVVGFSVQLVAPAHSTAHCALRC